MHYFILSVSKNHAQLFEVTGDRILPRGIDGMPTSLADAWKGMERSEQSLQFHSSGNGTAAFHGSGGVNDLVEKEEDQYLHMLAKSLHTFLHEQPAPLVFAGVAEAHGMFKKFDTSGRLLEDFIQGSPDQTPMETLKEKADPIVRAHLLAANASVLETYGALQGTGRTSTDPVHITAHAQAGKVETLLLPASAGDADRALIQEVRKHRGSVVVLEPATMPEGSTMAAILRL